MASLFHIENLTKSYADVHRMLAAEVAWIEDQIRKVKARREAKLKRLTALVSERRAALIAAIEATPELFASPRTVTFHDVKVGLQKGKGRLEWDDDNRLVALIRRHFPGKADVLIRTVETPSKAALAELSAAELKRLGVRVEETGDQVVIKPMPGEAEKAAAALLAGAAQDQETA